MEEYTMVINFIANLILCLSFAGFMVFLFGRTNSRIYQLPWYKTIFVKFALALCTTGALLNAFMFSNPVWTEVLLNAGLAMLFGWAAWFHYKTFVIPYKESMRRPKKKKKTKRHLTKA
jgi:hypothetical protein